MSPLGKPEVWEYGGFVVVSVREPFSDVSSSVSLGPDEARLFALKVIRMADEAERGE